MSDQLDLDALEAKARAATQGKWRGVVLDNKTIDVRCDSKTPIVSWMGFDDSDRSNDEHAANARHIAAFCPAAALLLIELARAGQAAIDAAVKAEREELIAMAMGLRFLSPSPIGPSHAIGWDGACHEIADSIRRRP